MKSTKYILIFALQKVANRDIKLENILLDKEYQFLKLCDFGLSKVGLLNTRSSDQFTVYSLFESHRLLGLWQATDIFSRGDLLWILSCTGNSACIQEHLSLLTYRNVVFPWSFIWFAIFENSNVQDDASNCKTRVGTPNYLAPEIISMPQGGTYDGQVRLNLITVFGMHFLTLKYQ